MDCFRCDAIVARWDALIERVDHLAKEVASRNKEKNLHWLRKLQLYKLKKDVLGDVQVKPLLEINFLSFLR